jgi:Bacterial Ig-like domain (group 3)
MFICRYSRFIVATLVFMANANHCRAQETKQAAAPQSAERVTWRKSMVRIALPKKGCFHASFPNKEWKEVTCSKLSIQPLHPQHRGGNPPNVGGGGATDWSAESAGIITVAEGSFMSATGLASETDSLDGLANSFSLQLNSRPFQNTTTKNLCSGAATPSACQGWVQFVYSNNSPPGFCSACGGIQYWLVPYGGATCPTGWTPDVGDCFQNSQDVPLSPVTIANLTLMNVTGKTTGGTDTAIADNGSGTLTATNSDSLLDLGASWNVAEFNIFGNGGGSTANFNAGTTIDVETSITDGTSNAPTCFDQSFTGEKNNLNLANVTGSSTVLVCCPYSGSPRIEFMQTNASPAHTATCGPTRIEGDPHITTADGTHYDFQGAGEFISLRDRDGAEIQTRQTPIATTALGTDGHDDLSTCVSLNTAVAARVGDHRVTYEPNLSGIPDPTGLQLRIDGVLTALGPFGINLGNSARVVQSLTGGDLEIDFPDGKMLFVAPQFWTTYGKWYLNVDVSNTGLISTDGGALLGGIAGPIPDGSWIPALPSGASMGPMPAALPQRYSELYHKFADAWRVTKKDSLFDYAPGTSTDTFTDKAWPLEKAPCVVPEKRPVEPIGIEIAEAACRRVADPNRHSDCVFDVRTTGNPGFATTYLTTQRILKDSTSTRLVNDPEPSQLGESVTFTAFVSANGPEAVDHPSGTVQFAVDGISVDAPLTLDAKGRATWETTALKVGKHQVTATYAPAVDSVFLPSTSGAKIHVVKRCPCAEHDYK